MVTRSRARRTEMKHPLDWWEDRFRKGVFLLLRGRDYIGSQASIVQRIRNEATQRGLKVSIDAGSPSVVGGEIEEKIVVRVKE